MAKANKCENRVVKVEKVVLFHPRKLQLGLLETNTLFLSLIQ